MGYDRVKSIFAGDFDQESAIEAAVELYGVDATIARQSGGRLPHKYG